ncbi:unnamed protein product [Schistosoma mattheei]|uniref:Uncharacterized protein n=1 Tax=Schistosoma mattheei TaxID=31246 RepID=A0AA85AU78_9TREM|nr:unnamed protein product [Schistosoma mattheei]
MDAGERSSTDASGPPDSTGQMLSSRLSQLHSIQEARIALKYLFRQLHLNSQLEIVNHHYHYFLIWMYKFVVCLNYTFH